MMCHTEKGVSANQLHQVLGISYKSAWFMAHRIRYAFLEKEYTKRNIKLRFGKRLLYKELLDTFQKASEGYDKRKLDANHSLETASQSDYQGNNNNKCQEESDGK